MNSKNPVNWFEIYVDDIARAKKFYETVFGIELMELPNPNETDTKMYAFPWEEGGINATGAIVHTDQIKAGGNSTVVYFQTNDCLTEQNRVESAGGKVFMPKFSIGEYGYCAWCVDTEGNYFGLHSRE